MSSPNYSRGQRSLGHVPYRLMVWLPLRYELLSAARRNRNRTGNRGPRPDRVEAQASTDSKHRPRNKVDSRRLGGHSVRFGGGFLRVGRELNPPGGKPDPRVKSPMLYLAELPTRQSPQQTAVLYSVLQPDALGAFPLRFRGAFDPEP